MEINKVLENLKVRGFEPFYFENRNEAIDKIISIVGDKKSIGFGGSMTVHDLGLMDILEEKGHTILSHSKVKPEDRDHVYQLAQRADFYVSSTNALTEQGEFVNIDGAANRVTTFTFGVKNIIFVLGTNKITKDVTSAINRIRNYAAPKNCVRLHKNTPCATLGHCVNCNSDDCICNTTVISHHPTSKQEHVYVIIINEELGY